MIQGRNKMRHSLKLFRLFSFFILVLQGSGINYNTLASERVRWKLQITAAGTENHVKQLIDQIKTISEGKIKFRLYKVNSLVSGLVLHTAIGEGQIEAGFSIPGYLASKIPAVVLFGGVPFGPRYAEHYAWMQHGGGQQLKDRIYGEHGLISLECGVEPPESGGWFNKRHEKVEDLRGIKMRTFGLGGKVLKKFGVSPTSLGPYDIVPSVKNGVIDATEFSTPQWDHWLGLQKIFKYYYFPSWHQPYAVHELVINKQKWDGLGKAGRLIIMNSCNSLILEMMGKSNALQPQAMRDIKQEGVKFVRWRDSELKKLRQAWHEVAEEESEKDPLFAEVYQSYKSFREQYAIWGDRAYLN